MKLKRFETYKINESKEENKCCIDCEDLKKYGKVTKCEEKGDKLYIKIEDGFDTNMKNTLNLMNSIISKAKDYPLIDKYVTDDNKFELVLKKK